MIITVANRGMVTIGVCNKHFFVAKVGSKQTALVDACLFRFTKQIRTKVTRRFAVLKDVLMDSCGNALKVSSKHVNIPHLSAEAMIIP